MVEYHVSQITDPSSELFKEQPGDHEVSTLKEYSPSGIEVGPVVI